MPEKGSELSELFNFPLNCKFSANAIPDAKQTGTIYPAIKPKRKSTAPSLALNICSKLSIIKFQLKFYLFFVNIKLLLFHNTRFECC